MIAEAGGGCGGRLGRLAARSPGAAAGVMLRKPQLRGCRTTLRSRILGAIGAGVGRDPHTRQRGFAHGPVSGRSFGPARAAAAGNLDRCDAFSSTCDENAARPGPREGGDGFSGSRTGTTAQNQRRSRTLRRRQRAPGSTRVADYTTDEAAAKSFRDEPLWCRNQHTLPRAAVPAPGAVQPVSAPGRSVVGRSAGPDARARFETT
jgi:hypothetical protein